jgi:uncharacterized protein YqeY
MTLKETLEADLRTAMRAGDDMRKTTVRAVLAAARQGQLEKREALIKARRKALGLLPGDEVGLDEASLDEIDHASVLGDEDYIAAVRREAKARRESLADDEKAGRADLAAAHRAELALLEAYLPRPLTRDEIAARAQAVIAELGASGPAAQGNVMKRLMPEFKGQADGKLVGDVVRHLLSQ